jgi:hypothetical protein
MKRTLPPVRIILCFFVVFATSLAVSTQGFAQEPAEARAILSCLAKDDPHHQQVVLTGLFAPGRTQNLFSHACDHSEVKDGWTVQELVTLFATSGPRALADALVTTTVQIAPIPDCTPGQMASAFGFTEAAAVIELSIAIRTLQPPPIALGTIPGSAVIHGALWVNILPPTDVIPKEENLANAAAGFFDGMGQALGVWELQISEGEENSNIEETISLDMITTGEDMLFSKAAAVETELYALEPCEGGDSEAHAQAIIDPIFEFDQARFDAEQGDDSFPLDEFFEILVSPNIGELVHRNNFENR